MQWEWSHLVRSVIGFKTAVAQAELFIRIKDDFAELFLLSGDD